MSFVSFDNQDSNDSFIDFSTPQQEKKIEPRGFGGLLKDTAVDIGQGVVSFGESAVGLGDIVTGGAIGKGLEKLGYDPKQTHEFLSGFQSEGRRESEKEVQEAQGFWDTAKSLAINPDVLFGNIVQSLPGTIGSGAVAGVLVKKLAGVAMAEAGVLGLTGEKATEFVAKKVADSTIKIAAAAGAAEGAQTAGSIAEAGRQSGQDWSTYVAPAIAAGLGTTAIGMVSGGIGRKLGIGDVETDIASRAAGVKGVGIGAQSFAKRVPAEMLKEGVLEEMPQSAQEQIAQNIATGRPATEGVGEAAAQGLMAGAGMAGGHAVLSGRNAPQAAMPPTPQEVPQPAPLQLENVPDPFVSFPDGTVGKRADVENYLQAIPEEQRNEARAKLFGFAPQDAKIEDITQAETVDTAIAAAEAVISQPDQIDHVNNFKDYALAEQARRDADTNKILEEVRNQRVAQAEAITRAQGFDTPSPNAMQLALQAAQEKLRLATTPVSSRDQAAQQQVQPSIALDSAQNVQSISAAAQIPVESRISQLDSAQDQQILSQKNLESSVQSRPLPTVSDSQAQAPLADTSTAVRPVQFSSEIPSQAPISKGVLSSKINDSLPVANPQEKPASEIIPAFLPKEKGMSTPEADNYIAQYGEYSFGRGDKGKIYAARYAKNLQAGEGGTWKASQINGSWRAERTDYVKSEAANDTDTTPTNLPTADVVTPSASIPEQRQRLPEAGRATNAQPTQEQSINPAQARTVDDGNNVNATEAVQRSDALTKAQEVKAILDSAKVTGTERRESLKDIAAGNITVEQLKEIHPPKEENANVPEPAAIRQETTNQTEEKAAGKRKESDQQARESSTEVTRYTSRQTTAQGGYKSGTGMTELNARQFASELNKKHPELNHEPSERDNGMFDVVGREDNEAPLQSRGKPTNQTNTPAFKKWFGDSKVVDENGNPLVVYHGTRGDKNFQVFDSTFGNPSSGGGHYFTDSYELAKKFGDVREFYLKIENPLLDGFNGSGAVMAKSEYRDGGIFTKRVTDKYAKKGTREFIVFDQTQIKSANGNNGQFDANNPSILQSRSNNSSENIGKKALEEISNIGDAFKYKKSDKQTLEGIFNDVDSDIGVRKITNIPGETRYELTLPDETIARVMVRPFNKYGASLYGYDFDADHNMSDQVTERPGKDPEAAYGKDDVWIDVSLLNEGGGFGSKIYHAVSNYAYNTGKIFIGDPAGVTHAAMLRRPEQMLSSALKFGTTEHLAPHPRQIQGDSKNGIAPLDWIYGDDIGNIKKLVDVNLQNIENAGGIGGIEYDDNSGEFVDADKNRITQDDLRGLAKAGLAGAAKAGGGTFARYAFLSSILQSLPEGQTGRQSVEFMAELSRKLRDHVSSMDKSPERTKDIFYSKRESVSGLKANDVNKAIVLLRAKWLNFTKINVVQSVADIPSEITDRFTPDEQTEGFYDPQTKSVYLVADNISSNERAIWVSAHEVLGHGGLRMLNDKTVTEALNIAGANAFVQQLAKSIKQDRQDISNKVATEEAIAELSAAVETNDFNELESRYGVVVPTSAKNGIKGAIARVYAAVKRFYALITRQPIADVSDAEVRGLINAQREAVQSGAQKDVNPGDDMVLASSKEEDRELVITHNLTADNLIHADKMGGIAVPSLAVTKNKSTLEGFGEITLIGSRKMADPKGYAKTKVFGADVYSPRYPGIDYKIDRSVIGKINNVLADLNKKFGIGEILSSQLSNGDTLRNLTDLNSIKAAALAEKGIIVDPVITDGKIDDWKSKMALRTAMQENDLYGIDEKYAKNLLSESGAEERIFKGYTASGNRTYMPHTLDNVVKILKKEIRGGENYNYGAGSLRAKFTPEFKTIADIRNNKDRLVDDGTFQKMKTEINDELVNVSNLIGSKNQETAIAILEDAPKMGLERAAKQFNIELTAEAKDRAAEFLNKLRTFPTAYFEAKILRDVSLSEFSGAVIPTDSPQKVRDILNRAGVQFTEYTGEENRAEAVREFSDELHAESQDILFSKSVLIGNNDRQRTPEQLQAFKNVGRTIEVPTIKERLAALYKDAGKKMVQGIVDQFAPIKDLSKEAYNLMRLSKGASGAFEVMLKGGQLKLENGVYNFDETKKGGVIDRLLTPLQGEADDFLWWVSANRAEQLSKEDREHLFKPEDIAAIKTLDAGVTTYDYTLQHGTNKGSVTHDRTLIYRDALKTFNEFHKNTLDMAEQSGLIDPEMRKIWEGEFYVPFYRADEDAGLRGANIKSGVVRQQAFKTLKGGTDKLHSDLLENTLMNWAHLLDAAAKNRAAKSSLEAAANMGVATEVDASAKNNVWFMENGQKKHYVVDDPFIMTAIQGLEYAGMHNPVMNVMSAFKRYLTIGVTASPFFKVRNLIRDSIQAVGVSDLSYNVAKNLKEGYALTDPKSDAYFRLLAGGGTIHFGSMLEGSESKRVRSLVEAGVDDSTILDSESKYKAFYKRVIEPAIDAYQEIGNRGEAINRAALYDQMIKQGKTHAEASLLARDLMDFSMSGSFASIRFLTQVVPFMNARLQGLYKLGKSAKENPAKFATVLGAVALSSLALMLAYEDDDDWKKREDWDINNYWWFKIGGEAFRIPRPFEIGAIGMLAERSFQFAFDKEMTNKRFKDNVLQLLGDSLSMNPIPQLAKPLIDLYANKNSFTGRPIEPMGMENLKSEYRFNGNTTMAARGLSTGMNAVTGIIGKEALSPMQIDNMLRSYFGWLGAFVISSGDLLARPMTDQPSHATSDYFKLATGGMVSNVSDAQSRYVSAMYDQAKSIEKSYGTWRMLMKEGKIEEAKEFFAENKQEISKYKSIEGVKRIEAKLSEQIRIIERSNKTPDEKRLLIRDVQAKKDRIARTIVQ